MMEPSKSFPKPRELLASVKKQTEKIESTPEMIGVATYPAKPLSENEAVQNSEIRWHHVSILSSLTLFLIIVKHESFFILRRV